MDATYGGMALILSSSFVYLGVVLSLLWAWKVTVKALGMRDWTIGFACIGIGQVLYLLYTMSGILPLAAIGYIAEIIGLILVVRGSELFIFGKSSIIPEMIIGMLGIVSSAILTGIYPQPLFRLALGNSAFALLQFRVAILFLVRRNNTFRQSIKFLSLIFVLMGTAELLQVAIALVYHNQESYLQMKPLFSVIYQLGYIGLMMTAMHLAYARFQLALTQKVEERNTLLKEMHHRTKNNLALVASLLSLESNQFPDSGTSEAFNRLRTRVQTISSLHEQLQYAETNRLVHAKEYLSHVLDHMSAQYAENLRGVQIVSTIAEIAIDSKIAITLGLIINEIVSNAMKHAFPSNRSGMIRINLSTNGHYCELLIDDDGIGNHAPVREGALGMQLVHAMVSQLSGILKHSTESGTRYQINFPVPMSVMD